MASARHYSRGKIKILNREALGEVTCECYGAVKEHHRLLLGGNTVTPGTISLNIDHPAPSP